MDASTGQDSINRGTQQMTPRARYALALLPVLRINWIVMQQKLTAVKLAFSSRRPLNCSRIERTLDQASYLIDDVKHAMSVLQQEVGDLAARNSALRRENALLLERLIRTRQEARTVGSHSRMSAPVFDEVGLAPDASSGSATTGSFQGIAIQDATAPTGPPDVFTPESSSTSQGSGESVEPHD